MVLIKEGVALTKKAQQLSAFVFGVVFLAIIVTLAILFPTPTTFQYTTFRIVLSLAAAGVAGMVPGFLSASVSRWIRASGALAVFVIVYFYNPASLVTAATSQINSIKGDQDQVINGNAGSITIENSKSTSKVREGK